MLKRVSRNATAFEEAMDWSKLTATAGRDTARGEGDNEGVAIERL